MPDELEMERLRNLVRHREDLTPMPPQLLAKLRHPGLAAADDEPQATLPERIGDYRIVAERGRGGMGVVYEAFDDALGRRVAVKVLATSRYSAAKHRERFRREVRAAASLQHENLVPVFAAETPDDGPPFLVMPFIDGPTLGDLIAARRGLEPRFAAGLLRQVADGVQALHAAGFIHRDIKPGNILLTADGVPKLTDFGLAREETGHGVTTADTIAGTPGYLSPEQIHSPQAVDARSDVYSLGATLYECLSGVPPFRGATLDVLRIIVDSEPVPPRSLNARVPRDLETICLKCLEKRPEKRYPSAVEFQNDLERYLENKPILARPAGRVERSVRWVQRNPWAAAVVAVSVFGAVAAGLGWQRAAEKTALAEESARQESIAAAAAVKARRQADEQAMLALGTINTLVGRAQTLADRSPGTLTLKKQLSEIALADLRRLSASMDRVEGAEAATVRAYLKLSDAYRLLGNLPDARQQLNRALAVALALPRVDDEMHELQGMVHLATSTIDRFEGKIDDSLREATTAVKSLEHARLRNGASYPIARQLAVAHNSCAEAFNFKGDTANALAEHNKSLALCESLLPQHAAESQLIRDLAFTESRLAMVHSLRFEFTDADRHSAAASRYAQRALEMDPANADRQRTARIAVLDHANILCNRGDYAAAEKLLREVCPQLAAAANQDPESPSLARDVAVGHSLTGAAELGLYRFDEAAGHLDQSLTIREKLGTLALTDLLQIGQLLLAVEVRRQRYDRCVKVCDRMLAAIDQLGKTAGPNPQMPGYRKSQFDLKRAYELVPAVIATPATLDQQPIELRPQLGCILAFDHARSGRMEEALKTIAGLDGSQGSVQIYAMFLRSMAAAEATADRDAHLAAAHAIAVKLFKDSPGLRYTLLNFPELLPLRAYPPFQQLLASMN